jgi:uncharacterized membrane protein
MRTESVDSRSVVLDEKLPELDIKLDAVISKFVVLKPKELESKFKFEILSLTELDKLDILVLKLLELTVILLLNDEEATVKFDAVVSRLIFLMLVDEDTTIKLDAVYSRLVFLSLNEAESIDALVDSNEIIRVLRDEDISSKFFSFIKNEPDILKLPVTATFSDDINNLFAENSPSV